MSLARGEMSTLSCSLKLATHFVFSQLSVLIKTCVANLFSLRTLKPMSSVCSHGNVSCNECNLPNTSIARDSLFKSN